MDPAAAARHQLRRHNPGDALRWSLTCPLLPDHGSPGATGGGLESVVVSTPSAARSLAPRESVVTAPTSPDLAGPRRTSPRSLISLSGSRSMRTIRQPGRWRWLPATSGGSDVTSTDVIRSSRGWIPLPARTRWPSCLMSASAPARDRAPRGRTPTRMPRRGSSRCSPTRPAALTSR
jgi:hypothetical protein